MAYEAQNFDHLLGLTGFSNQLLQNHFKLYAGYVTNFNKKENLGLPSTLNSTEGLAGNLMACAFMNFILEI